MNESSETSSGPIHPSEPRTVKYVGSEDQSPSPLLIQSDPEYTLVPPTGNDVTSMKISSSTDPTTKLISCTTTMTDSWCHLWIRSTTCAKSWSKHRRAAVRSLLRGGRTLTQEDAMCRVYSLCRRRFSRTAFACGFCSGLKTCSGGSALMLSALLVYSLLWRSIWILRRGSMNTSLQCLTCTHAETCRTYLKCYE